MHTHAQIAAEATKQLKEAKTKANSAGKDMSWDEVCLTIFNCLERAQQPASLFSTAAVVTVDAIYAIYPRKKQPRTAKKAIANAAKRVVGEPDPLAYLLARTQLYATAVALWPKDERQYVPYPASWFNADSFDENPKDWEERCAKVATAKDYSRL